MHAAVGIYVFDEVEVLDFTGPYEVFTTAARVYHRRHTGLPKPFRVFTVARQATTIRARAGLVVVPDYAIDGHPAIDLLLIPGGVVTAQLEDRAVLEWIGRVAARAKLVASVCTGAFLLAKTGLLDGKSATTHWEDIADMQAMFPSVAVRPGCRWIDEGTIITSAGISAGIDMSLYLVARLAGRELAERTARQMDFDLRLEPLRG